MTRTQLQTLYSFANLPYSEQSENLNDLRKYLLLELKDDQVVLSIEGKSWSKNDVLFFFKEELSAQTFDYIQFIEDFPWVKRLENMDTITFDESLLLVNLNDARFMQFAEQESKVYEEPFLRIFKQHIIRQRYKEALGLLQYRRLFTPYFQAALFRESELIVKKTHQDIIDQWSRNELTVKQLNFYFLPDYYKFISEVGNSELRKLIITTIHVVIELFSIASLEEIVEHLLEIKQNIEEEVLIRRIAIRVSIMKFKKPLYIFEKRRLKRFFGNKNKVINTVIFLSCIFILYKCLSR